MKEFVEFIAKHLVDKPDEVKVTEIEGERTTVYELRVGAGELGKIIGKHGQMARSIRTLLGAASAKTGKVSTALLSQLGSELEKGAEGVGPPRPHALPQVVFNPP